MCRVEVVKDGLKTKSMWWRKCPLQISNADRQLLHGEQSFTLFAEGSAAKEQWYAALREAAGSAPSREAVEALYARFCDLARAGGSAPRYPQVGCFCNTMHNPIPGLRVKDGDFCYFNNEGYPGRD